VEQCNFGKFQININDSTILKFFFPTGSVVHKNELYVIGGCFNQSLEENVHPFGFRYKPICNNSSNSWSTIAPMQRERCRFTLIAVDNYLYAIGGAAETEYPVLDDEFTSGEIYDPMTDEWSPMASLPVFNRSQHAAVSFNHYIYVSGGLDQDIVLRDLVRYNTLTDEWDTSLAQMLSPRADHTMIAYNAKLYVCGGWYEDGLTGMRVLVDTIDCYDIITNTWTIVSTIPTPRYHSGIVNMGSNIYIIGGFLSDNTFDRASGIIESFNLVDHTWNQSLDNYPQDIWEHHCCALFVPKHRDDLEVITEKM
jgi:N-acetylneuraminic acid mutarotase